MNIWTDEQTNEVRALQFWETVYPFVSQSFFYARNSLLQTLDSHPTSLLFFVMKLLFVIENFLTSLMSYTLFLEALNQLYIILISVWMAGHVAGSLCLCCLVFVSFFSVSALLPSSSWMRWMQLWTTPTLARWDMSCINDNWLSLKNGNMI